MQQNEYLTKETETIKKKNSGAEELNKWDEE